MYITTHSPGQWYRRTVLTAIDIMFMTTSDINIYYRAIQNDSTLYVVYRDNGGLAFIAQKYHPLYKRPHFPSQVVI